MSVNMTMETICLGFSSEIPDMICRRLDKIGIDLIVHGDRSRWMNPDGKTNTAGRYIYPSAGIPYVESNDNPDLNMPTICLAQEVQISRDVLAMQPKGFHDFYEDIRGKVADGLCRELVSLVMPLYDNPDPCVVEAWMRSPIMVKSYPSHYTLKEILRAELRFSIFSPNIFLADEYDKGKYIESRPNILDAIVDEFLNKIDEEEE